MTLIATLIINILKDLKLHRDTLKFMYTYLILILFKHIIYQF